MTIRMATSALVLSLLFFWLRGVMALAAPPAEPQPGTDFQAVRAFVGDPVLGIEPADPGSLFTYLPDTALPMASVTKSFTLLLAVEAIMNGSVALTDIITVSAHAGTINNGHGGGHSVAGLTTGQVILFEDLLYGMMLPSGGDASIAIGEHVAGAAHPAFAGLSPYLKHLVFVAMMNNRAQSLGLDDTEFFNSYGGDHAHAPDNTPGSSVPHRATARDIARWFEVGISYPLFREVAGFQGTYPGFGWSSGFSYPGLVAQKPGGNGSCTQCRGAAARRVGREIVAGFEDGAFGDMTPLLDYGYASLFHPTLEVESAPYTKGWARKDLACVSSDRAASAVVRADGTLRMLLWGVDVAAPSIEHLNPILVGPWGVPNGGLKFQPRSEPRSLPLATIPPVQVAPVQPAYASRQGTPPPPPPVRGVIAVDPGPRGGGIDAADDFGSGHKTPVVLDARVASAEDGHLVVAATTSQGVYLHAFGIYESNTIGLRDTEFVGAGDLGRIEVLHNGIVMVGHRDGAGVLRLNSFRLDTTTGLLTNELDEVITSSIGEELEMRAGRAKGLRQSLAVAFVGVGGQRILRSWEVNRLSGSISSIDSISTGGAVSQLAFERVKGFGTREIYALAFRTAGGRLAVDSYEISPDGTITGMATRTQTDRFVSVGASIRMAAYEDGGVMIAMQPTSWDDEQVLETWSLDPASWSASSTVNISTLVPNRIAQEVVAQAGVHGLCRVPAGQAEGDFLLATGDPAEGGITLQSWRSAPR